jgi:hypothetical protein
MEVPMTTTTLDATVACPECNEAQQVNKDGTVRKHGRPVRCAGSGQPVGEARIPRRAQGFYRDPATGERLRSVTTILNQGSPKEALIHWAGNLVAETAIEHLPDLMRASRNPETRTQAYDWLRQAPNRKKDDRADIGSAVHKLIESHILQEPIPADLLENPDLTPYIEHFHRFVDEWQIEFTASEMVVANYDEKYAGTLDFTLTSPLLTRALDAPDGVEFMGDTKTGGELDTATSDGGVKGVYPEAGVQMSAYRRAPYGWLRDGTRVTRPLAHEVGVILHLRPQGYRLYPVRCSDAEYAAFQSMRAVAEFQTGPAKSVVGTALTVPTPQNRKVA